MIDKKYKLPSDIARKRLIKVSVNTNQNYGKKPEERGIPELLNNGFINIDKPCGPTSHQVDAWIKEILEIDKVGHHGTLDPHATGVLPIGIGDSTKALNVLHRHTLSPYEDVARGRGWERVSVAQRRR